MKPIKIKYIIAITVWLLVSGSITGYGENVPQTQKNRETEPIMEKVTVVNTRFPVRVFLGKKPVSGLEKKDFKLYVDGKETPINGFFEVKKTLKSPPPPPPAQRFTTSRDTQRPSRLFVLIFNVSDYDTDLETDVNIIFGKIIRPEDRFMVISNNYFLPETIVKNIEIQKKRVIETLRREAQKLKLSTSYIELHLKSLGDNFLANLTDTIAQEPGEFPYEVFRDFFRDYILTFEEFKQGYFDMAKEQYIKIAEYLRTQDAEKWVLNVFQVGIFPRFKLHGRIQNAINTFTTRPTIGGTGSGSIQMKSLVMDYLQRLDDVDKWMVDNISKLFVNSGATVHTLLRKPIRANFMDQFEYRPVSTDSESILRQIARLTGGSVVHSRDADKFIDKIYDKEDVYYMLTYVPEKNEPLNTTIRVAINSDQNYRLIYDNQRKPRFFKKILARLRRYNPQIKIGGIALKDDTLSVKISNMKTISLNRPDDIEAGRIEARVTIMDTNSAVVWETRKLYRSEKSEAMFQTKVPPLKKGYYNILVEVRDLLSWKTDALGENIRAGT